MILSKLPDSSYGEKLWLQTCLPASKKKPSIFSDLAANNNKTWFDEHKPDYEADELTPARDLVVALGEKLQALYPNVVADPRVNKSVFRIYRDIRFSKYATQLN